MNIAAAAADPAAGPIGLDPCLARLDAAIEAARALGIPTDEADAVRSDAAARLGFPSDAYVLALVGGTGVGKSSLLNTIAGADVSRASVLRPTTARPVAWLSESSAAELGELLDWLGVASEDTHETASTGLGAVAILDLPDLDSTAADHRARVEAVLPRVDAVVWVTDPEKYGDAVLHDDFLADWLPRLARQIVIVNKADRLTNDDAESVRRDLERDLARRSTAGGGRQVPRARVILASATGGGSGIDELRRWLAEQVESKAVIRTRLIASIRDAVASLARAAGIDPAGPDRPLLSEAARRQALDDATTALLRIVDLPQLERQAVAATRARARARGAGPLGAVTSRLYRWSGRQTRVADPVSFLARWRDRGPIGPAAEPIRAASAEPLRTTPPGTRRFLARNTVVGNVERALGGAVDRAVASRGDEVPSSPVWPVLGLLQTAATLALVVTAIWVGLWVFVKFPVDSISLPVVGLMPTPFVVLIGVLAAGYLLARLLGLHAGWVGRRWARRLAAGVRANVEREVATAAFGGVEAVEAARSRLWEVARGIDEDCPVA